MNLRRRTFESLLIVAAVFVLALCVGCGAAGSAAPETSSVGKGAAPPPGSPTILLSANLQTVVAGQLTTLSWTASNASSISFAPALSAPEERQLTLPTGSETFPPSGTTTYVATVTNSNGQQASANLTITVLPVQFDFSAEPDTIQPGGTATLS